MSQEKVDKRKYEKKNRKVLERKRRIRTTIKCVVVALIIGAIIGVPLGIKIYKEQPKFIGDSVLEAFVDTYIEENYATEIAGLGENGNSEEGTTENEVTKAVEEAAGNELEKVDSDNIDELLEGDSGDSQESSESTQE